MALGSALPILMTVGRWRSSSMPVLYTRKGTVTRYYAQRGGRQ